MGTEISLTNEIQTRLRQFVQREQPLLSELLQLKKQQGEVKADIGIAIVVKGMAALAADVFESSQAVSHGRRVTRPYLDQTQKEQRIISERSIESRYDITVQEIGNFLSSISVKKKTPSKPNSAELIARVDKAHDFERTDTHIRRTVRVLGSLLTRQLL